MKLSALMPSKYFKPDHIEGTEMVVTVSSFSVESMGMPGKEEEKPVMYFEEAPQGLPLNKTRLKNLQAVFGTDETDDMVGEKVLLVKGKATFQGEMVDSIYIQPAPKSKAVTKAKKEQASLEEDDIPFA